MSRPSLIFSYNVCWPTTTKITVKHDSTHAMACLSILERHEKYTLKGHSDIVGSPLDVVIRVNLRGLPTVERPWDVWPLKGTCLSWKQGWRGSHPSWWHQTHFYLYNWVTDGSRTKCSGLQWQGGSQVCELRECPCHGFQSKMLGIKLAARLCCGMVGCGGTAKSDRTAILPSVQSVLTRSFRLVLES